MNDIVLQRPELLLLLLLLLPLLLLGVQRLAALAARRRVAAVLFQSISVALLVLALAEPVRVMPDPGMNLVVVLDASDSLSVASRTRVQQYAADVLAKAGPDDTVQFVAFGANAVVLSADEVVSGRWAGTGEQRAEGRGQETPGVAGITPTATTQTALTDTQHWVLSTGHSDLSAGLQMAGSLLRDTGRRRVVLVSDGWETQGQASSEAGRLAARGIDLQVVGLSALGDPEVIVKYLATTPYARIGDTISSDLRIYSTTATTATLRVSVDGGAPSNRNITLRAGENRVPLEQKAATEGYHSINVSVAPGSDSAPENNSASAATVVKPSPSVLVVEERRGESYALAQALANGQMDITVSTLAGVSSRVSDLNQFDSIVLDNVAATSLTLDQQRTLQEYVRGEGKGLVVVGGTTAYARGGYLDSVFEEILPVSSEPAPRPQQGQTALILVLDHSFSMTEEPDLEGNNKLTMAREAAALAVDALRTGDYLGVITFDTETEWTVPFSAITDDASKARAQSNIRRIAPGGGTSIFPAVSEAAAAIRDVDVPNKHIVLLTDGRERRGSDYGTLINAMRADGVSLSTIGVGRDVDKAFLTELATLGQGRFYFTERLQNIPKIVFQELQLALKETIVEGNVTPQILSPSPVLNGFRPQDIPELTGYDITTAKDEAVTALLTNQGDPLLAHWNYGLGRVVAFTSDSGLDWTVGWRSWSQFSRFWNQAVRWSMASPIDPLLQPSVVVEERDGVPVAHIYVESLAANNSFVDLADVTAALQSPSGAVSSATLAQTAPGRYEAIVPLTEAGAYEVRLQRSGGGGDSATETVGFSVPPSEELLQAGTNDRLLTSLIGGKDYQTEPAQALDRTGLEGRAPDSEPLWPYLVGPALLLLLLSVAARRVDFRVRRA